MLILFWNKAQQYGEGNISISFVMEQDGLINIP